MLSASIGKLEQLNGKANQALEILKRTDAKIGFGTDLLGAMHSYQSREFGLRPVVLSAIDILCSATSVNAELLMQSDQLGCIKAGALADLLVVDGDPLTDISVFERHEQTLCLIMKGGKVFKNELY